MTKKHVLAFVVLGTVAAVGWAVSNPISFTPQTAARAADVNANFTALTNAVNALEAKVAALEAVNTPLTAADVVGVYKLLGMSTSVGGNSVNDSLSIGSDSSNATVTFAANAACTSAAPCSFTYNQGATSNASANCMITNAQTSLQQSGDHNPHSHGYKITDCNSSTQDEAGGDTGGGTWSLGPAANTITVNPGDGQTLTAFISKRGGVGFAVEVEPTDDVNNPGRRIQLEVFVKQ